MIPKRISLKKTHCIILLTLLALFLVHCGVPVGTKYAPNSTTTTTQNTGCTTSVLDSGLKGTVVATQRGIWSDVKVPPNATLPAMAYYDSSSISIKFAYYSSGQLVVENVAGDLLAAPTASSIKLAFLSTGVPMIFWTTGSTTVKMAMRSANLSTASAGWTAAIIDTTTSAVTRALEVSVSPMDQVGVVYLTNTSNAGLPKFIYCNQNCSSPFAFIPMDPTNGYIENTAGSFTTAQVQTGVAWCKNSSSSYYPAVVYGGVSTPAAQVRYGVCQGALSTCQNSSGWTLMTVTSGGSGVQFISNKLLIDSTVVGDTPKILTKVPSGTLQAFRIDQACNTTPSSVTTNSNTFGTTNSGTAWMTLMKDQFGDFHVVANEAQTAVKYFNSTSADFTTTTWHGAGTVDTLTLPAGGSGGGGADISLTGGSIYSTYGKNAASYNLQVGVISNYSIASDSTSAVYSTSTPDSTGMIQLATANSQIRNVSVAATSGGIPAAAYIDYSGFSANTGSKLKYAMRNGTSASNSWTTYTIPGTVNPQNPSLAFDASNKPWISYYDNSNFRFYLLNNTATDGSGTWNSFQFPLVAMTAIPTAPGVNDTAIAMQYVNTSTAYPVMFINNASPSTPASPGIQAARYNTSTGLWSSIQTIDSTSTFSNLSADYLASTGEIAVSYFDITKNRVKYNYTTDPTAGFATSATVANSGGQGLTLKINPSTSHPALGYFDYSNNKVYYAACNETLASCLTTPSWSPTLLDTSAGVSGLAVAATSVLQASLAFYSSGIVSILYPSGATGRSSLMQATNSSGAFNSSVFASGTNGNLTGAAALNFALSGLNVSSIVTSRQNLVSVYVGPGNWLYVTSCGD